MELWTEYEGRTIDGAYPLKKLLLPEGRSAFFSTSNDKGEPTVIRLIASHFDEDEILARWRGVEALRHPNILKLENFGQLTLDETTVVYAVMEPVDANLAEVIRDQRLAPAEARQLASSIGSALETLHNSGFVHEHVEPANIYAVGEIVKLRGDCIRETPEGEAGIEARKLDIHNLGVVLLQAFGQQPPFEAVGSRSPLPAPFDQIVPNAIRGSWTLAEIRSAVGPDIGSANPTDYAGITASAVPLTSTSANTSQTSSNSVQDSTAAASQSKAELTENTNGHVSEIDSSNESFRAKGGTFTPPNVRARSDDFEGLPRTKTRNIWLAVAAAVLLVVWLIWHSVHGASVRPAGANLPAQNAPNESQPSVQTPSAAMSKPSASGEKNSAKTASPGLAPIREQWRVVAFTYNLREHAQKKVAIITQKHPDLHPQVFTPTGKAPFLVTVGGPMSREAAYAFAHKAGKWGLPRDTYAQNYSARQR